jgi:KaiC/GvpD/RAD55 family RecA-like ATPase
MNRTEHFVQFYESNDFIVNSVAEYVSHGLKTGETCVVIATNEHLDAIERRVESFGVDLINAREREAYIALDAESTLAKFMAGDHPDAKLFSKVIGSLIRETTKRAPVRAFGEMVALLVQDGKANAAVELEKLWNGLRQKHPFSLFCAYPMQAFATGEAAKFMGHVCDGHSRVIPDETYTALTSADERLRQVAFLQQRGRQLEAELAELEHRIAARKA